MLPGAESTDRWPLAAALAELEALYGPPPPPEVSDPWEMILFEEAAYLVDDERRAAVFAALRRTVGLDPEAIVAASDETLHAALAGGGMQPERRAQKLRRAARIMLSEFDGDLAEVVRWPFPQARKALTRFPGIGGPGAEKILLFSGSHLVLALESNGLRVLLRLGFGREERDYAAAYRSVQEDARVEMVEEGGWLVRAHQLLRRQGKELCRAASPACEACPLAARCVFYHRRLSRQPPCTY